MEKTDTALESEERVNVSEIIGTRNTDHKIEPVEYEKASEVVTESLLTVQHLSTEMLDIQGN